jgi:hypothetical protein
MSLLVISLVILRMRRTIPVAAANITLCDVDSSELCVVTFGTDLLDNMIINFQLPDADYPMFHVRAANRGNVNTYSCEVVTAVSTSVYCSGARTPLGEYIDMEIYAIKGDALIARGRFVVSALVRITPPVELAVTLTPIPESTFTNLTGTPPAP